MHGLVLAYHGCDQAVAEKVLAGKENIRASSNDFDWLGNGAYFWENDSARALDWARQLQQKSIAGIKTPAVIGAVIDLGNCLNLVRSDHLALVKQAFDRLEQNLQSLRQPLPVNKPLKENGDLLIRRLDCAVIEYLCARLKEADEPIDTVRAVFFEGDELYPNAGFRQKNHIQICVRDSANIKGYFRPLLN
jgi:hypothetical protein